MDFNDGYVSKEYRELHRSASESVDPVSVSPLQLSPPKSPKSPKSPRSPKAQVKGSNLSPKNNKQSHSSKDGRPKKGGVLFLLIVFVTIFRF
jgi:hypothetical protein